MELCKLRKRSQSSLRADIPLIYKLVLLLRSHKEYKIIATSSSLSFRVVCLCDMAIKNIIKEQEGMVVQCATPATDIEKEFIYKIGLAKNNARDTVRALNGEISKSLGIKSLKSKIFKEMETRNMIKVSKGTIYNKIILSNLDLWNEIHNGIVIECRDGATLETKILLVALDHINKMESFLLLCNEKDSQIVLRCLSEFKTDLQENRFKKGEELIFNLLRCLIK